VTAAMTCTDGSVKEPAHDAGGGGHRHRPRWKRPRTASGLMSANPRSRAQRRRDTEHRLTHDVDVWVASASAVGAPYLVPPALFTQAPRSRILKTSH
jgi:hypothetical protein